MLDSILLTQCAGRVLIVQLPHIRLRLHALGREFAVLQGAMDYSGDSAARPRLEPPVVQGFGEAIQSEAEDGDDERDHREYYDAVTVFQPIGRKQPQADDGSAPRQHHQHRRGDDEAGGGTTGLDETEARAWQGV